MTAQSVPHPFDPRGLRLALFAAFALGIAGRIAYGYGAPLWFDETFSGVIATQPTFTKLLDWCLNELTGPAYYMPLWAWAKIAGSGDAALRVPSLIMALAAPLLIAWKGAGDRELRWYWAILCLLWAPAFAASWDARGYAQLLLLGAVQALLFLRLIERPSLGRTAAWALVSTLLLLTHYWSALACVVQGVAFVAVHRRRAIARWPAALLFLPMAGWAYFHLPTVLAVTGGTGRADALSVLAEVPESLFGVAAVALIVLGAVIVSLIVGRGQRSGFGTVAERTLAVCGLVGVGCVIALACARPGFAPRYLTPSMPAFLFALAVWLRWAARWDGRFVIAVLAALFAATIGVLVSGIAYPQRDARHLFELERPSAWLAEKRPQRLIFFWDGAVAERSSAGHLAEVGGFFFKRAGRPVAVEVARVGVRDDPNQAVAAQAGGDAAILWIANEPLPEARTPHPERYDARLECRDFGGGQVTLTACRTR